MSPQQDKMPSPHYYHQVEEGDEGLGPDATSTHADTQFVLPLHSHNFQLMSSSSSDQLLAHHKTMRSHNPKSRSLDTIPCVSSYTTYDHSGLGAAIANTGNLTGGREVIDNQMVLISPNDLKMVPFKWEEAPGKPISTSSCNEIVTYNPSALQLPPRLQCQSNQSPLHIREKSQDCHHESPLVKKLTQPINRSLFRPSPNKQTLKKLCTYMLKTASCTRQTPPFMSHSCSRYPPCIEFSSTFDHNYKQQDKLPFHDRLFFDRFGPKDLRYCASMDSILPTFDPSCREDEFVSRKALNFLAMEEEHEEVESYSSTSSPWKPISFHRHEMEGSASPYWQPSPNIKHEKSVQHGGDDDDDDDDDDEEGFHDFFSTTSSMNPSQRTDCDAVELACSSPSPWYLDFSPEEEEVHVESRGSKLMVRLVAFIKLKRVISKFKRRSREGANHQLAESTMWSPTLATYLYNEQLEEEKQVISSSISTNCSTEDDGRSELGSNRLHIDPNYYLPSTIRTHFMNPNQHNHRDDESSISCGAHDEECQASYKQSSACCAEEKDGDGNHDLHRLGQRMSLKQQLAEFDDDDYSDSPFYVHRDDDCPALDGHPDTHFNARGPSPCKGMCKVRKTVKVLASAIKLILVHTEIGKKKGARTSFQGCIKPTLSTRVSLHFDQK